MLKDNPLSDGNVLAVSYFFFLMDFLPWTLLKMDCEQYDAVVTLPYQYDT